jgi:betaine-aldehyde dehydrogenase
MPTHLDLAESIEVRNPATGEVVGTVPVRTAAEVDAAVGRVRAQQPAWQALGPGGRAQWLRTLRDWLLDNEAHVVEQIQAETSKPRTEARIEISVVCDAINYFADRAAKFLADEKGRPHGLLTANKALTIAYYPYPVVGIVTPWNFPFLAPGLDSVPALLAGAAVVAKPSEFTPFSGLELVRGWNEIGAPPVVACVTGAGGTGAAVVDAVDMVQFTGSTRTGRAIAARAGERLIPCSVELGGKDAAIVLADADLVRAANGIAWGGMFNAGQACVSVERVYVEAPVHDEFVRLLTERVAALQQGAGDGSGVGSLANPAQVEIVRGHVADAVTRGARVLTGGRVTGTGSFFEPTVLVEVDHTMACMREETFGPTLPVMRVADEAEAIRLANDCRYGLSATVWTRNLARGEAVARRLEAGAVNINDAYANFFCFALPHGGWKESGVGARLGGAQGMRKYCRRQAITRPRVRTLRNEVLWYPYSRRRVGVVARVLRALVARDPRRRLTGSS